MNRYDKDMIWAALAVLVFAYILKSFIAMLIWNALMPGIFGLPILTFGQTFWLIFLIGWLFPYKPSSKD